MDGTPQSAMLTLTCRPAREGRTLTFDYTLVNGGEQDVFVQDGMPQLDGATRAVRANLEAVCVIHAANGDAVAGKFVPRVPGTARPALAVTPLARRLGAGQTMDRRLALPEPLAETSPYLPDLLLRQYEVVDIPAIVFTIAYWVAGGQGFGAMPTPYAEGLHTILLPQGGSPAGMQLASQRFATRGLQIFRRKDAFPRTM